MRTAEGEGATIGDFPVPSSRRTGCGVRDGWESVSGGVLKDGREARRGRARARPGGGG